MSQMVMERKLESESSKIHRRSQNVYELLRTEMNTRAGNKWSTAGGTEAPPTHSGSGLLDVFPGRFPRKPITPPTLCNLIFKCC